MLCGKWRAWTKRRPNRPLRDDLENLINTTAYRIYKRYRRWTEAADIRQEMWTYVCGLSDKRLAEIEVGTLRWRLHDIGEKFARKEKATRSGYHPDDEAFYGLRVIRELLPVAVDDEPAVLRAVNEAERGAGRRAGSNVPLEYETAIADLRGAYRRLSVGHRDILRAYVDGADIDETVVSAALRSMQRKLGGRRPRTESE